MAVQNFRQSISGNGVRGCVSPRRRARSNDLRLSVRANWRLLVYGSGDFHHLTTIWLRRLSRLTTVISFDNHPDWDIRPPKWACGSWVNRALELAQVDKVSVWGCGNFECWWPMRIFGNNLAEQSGRLEVHPWADDRSAKEQRRLGAILRSNWRSALSLRARISSTPGRLILG